MNLGLKCYMCGISSICETLEDAVKKADEWKDFINYRTSYDAVDPSALTMSLRELWLLYLVRRLWTMLKCEAILLLPNWEVNKMARIEYKFACILGMTIYHAVEDVEGEKRIIEEDATWNY